jgi:hypothetical protein
MEMVVIFILKKAGGQLTQAQRISVSCGSAQELPYQGTNTSFSQITGATIWLPR